MTGFNVAMKSGCASAEVAFMLALKLEVTPVGVDAPKCATSEYVVIFSKREPARDLGSRKIEGW